MAWSKEKKAAYAYDSVIKEVKDVIRYYSDVSHKPELIEDDKKMIQYDTQVLWVTYKAESGSIYHITSDRRLRDVYYLWKLDKKGNPVLTKHSSENPLDLYSHCK